MQVCLEMMEMCGGYGWGVASWKSFDVLVNEEKNFRGKILYRWEGDVVFNELVGFP